MSSTVEKRGRGRPTFTSQGKEVKDYQTILVERPVAIMFNLIAKGSGKNKSTFIVELLEMYRKQL